MNEKSDGREPIQTLGCKISCSTTDDADEHGFRSPGRDDRQSPTVSTVGCGCNEMRTKPRSGERKRSVTPQSSSVPDGTRSVCARCPSDESLGYFRASHWFRSRRGEEPLTN